MSTVSSHHFRCFSPFFTLLRFTPVPKIVQIPNLTFLTFLAVRTQKKVRLGSLFTLVWELVSHSHAHTFALTSNWFRVQCLNYFGGCFFSVGFGSGYSTLNSSFFGISISPSIALLNVDDDFFEMEFTLAGFFEFLNGVQLGMWFAISLIFFVSFRSSAARCDDSCSTSRARILRLSLRRPLELFSN